jgi:hypothetical protein
MQSYTTLLLLFNELRPVRNLNFESSCESNILFRFPQHFFFSETNQSGTWENGLKKGGGRK